MSQENNCSCSKCKGNQTPPSEAGLEEVINEWAEERDNESHQKIFKTCNEIREMLLEKNRKYGDSALNPIRVFSKASTTEQILVRLDDKLSRVRSAQLDEDEDIIKDLIGYLILLRISLSEKNEN